MGDIDPQKVPISEQLDKLKPIMETIAKEQNRSLEDIFIELTEQKEEAEISAKPGKTSEKEEAEQ